jgi:hypothetical protein
MGFSSFKSYGSQVAISKIITIVNNRPRPFIWLKFDSGDLTNSTTLRNYGSQGSDATLNKIGTGAYPQLLTTGQNVGTGCISLVAQADTQNGGYVSMSPITTTTNGITFAIWFKFETTGTMYAFSRLFDFGDQPNTVDIISYFGDYSNLVALIVNTDLVEVYNPVFNTGEWFHYALTIKPNGDTTAYVNGTFKATKNIPYPPVKKLNTINLGKSPFTTDPLLTAQLDDFRYYNVPLSDDDILALYNKTYD